jgi:hypothetical protein
LDVFQALLRVLPRLQRLALQYQNLLRLLQIRGIGNLVGRLLLFNIDDLLGLVVFQTYDLWLLLSHLFGFLIICRPLFFFF